MAICKVCDRECDRAFGEHLGGYFICDTCLEILFQNHKREKGVIATSGWRKGMLSAGR